jgi:hypothetical protein
MNIQRKNILKINPNNIAEIKSNNNVNFYVLTFLYLPTIYHYYYYYYDY